MLSLFSPLDFALGQFEVVPETVAQIYAQFGALHVGTDTTAHLKIYDLSSLLDKPEIVNEMLTRLQAQLVTFSHEYDPPQGIFPLIQDLKKRSYKTGHIWIYEPKVLHGSFNDAPYTRIWRVFHEMAHCAVEPFLYSRYGDSKRLGQLGKISKDTWQTVNGPKEVTLQPLSLRHAQRSVEWESLAFRAQRFLFADAGVTISNDIYQREYNINMSDAIFRAVTGKFGRPGAYGLVPHSRDIDLCSIIKGLEHAAKQIPMTPKITNKVLANTPKLENWFPISDDSIEESIKACFDKGISSVHTNWKTFNFYNIPSL